MRRLSILIVLLLAVGGTMIVVQADESPVYLPTISRTNAGPNNGLFQGYVKSCETTHLTTEVSMQVLAGQRLVYSSSPDGEPLGSSEQGRLRISSNGPVEGDWWLWLVDGSGQRTSEVITLHTDSALGLRKCQQATVVFYREGTQIQDPVFNVAVVGRCDPNESVTYVHGKTYIQGVPTSGDWFVGFSYAPDGPLIAKVKMGPHPGYEGWDEGFYIHILQSDGPREGNWWFWVVNPDDQRISEMASVYTDGQAGDGKCQQAIVDFDSR